MFRFADDLAHWLDMNQQLADLARRQDGLVTDADIRALGLARRARDRMFDVGLLRTVAPGVCAVGGAPTTHRTRFRAGLLSWVSYQAAASLHGPDRFRRDAVEFTVMRCRRVKRAQFIVHTTDRLPRIDRVEVDGFRTTSATRTIIDLAHARLTTRNIEAAIDSAVRMGLSSPRVLAKRLATLCGSGRWGCRLIEELVVDSGGHSPLERRFLTLVRRAGLVRPSTQVIHRRGGQHVARVDFAFEEHGLVVEVSGQHGHSSPTERARDAQRRNELQDLGLLVFEYTWRDVFHTPEVVVRTLTQRLAATA